MTPTVLLIDDSAILRRIATNVLGAYPLCCEVVTATRVTEGFARACAALPSLILIDSQLAGTAKAEICQRFLDEPRTARVPIILLLGRGLPVPAFSELPENVVDTLSKPFAPEQLNASVKAVLQCKQDDSSPVAIRKLLADQRQNSTAQLGDLKAVSESASKSSAVNGQQKNISVSMTTSLSPSAATVDAVTLAEPHAKPRTSESKLAILRAAFQKAAGQKCSGVLSIKAPDRLPLEIYFDAGNVVVVTTRDADTYSLNAVSVLPAKVSPATLEAALDVQRDTGVPFMLTLGARGLLSKASAVELLHQFGQRQFAQYWELRRMPLQCVFTPLDALPGFALRLEPRRESVDEWLLATLRCMSSEDIIATAKHEGFVGTPVFLRNGQSLLNFLDLTTQEKEFARRVTGRIDLPTIAKSMGITAEGAYLRLYRFRALEIMDYRPAPAGYVVTPRTSFRRVLPLRR